MIKQYTVEPAYIGNVKIKKYIDGKFISSTVVSVYDLSGYQDSIEDDGFEFAEDVELAKALMEKARQEYENAVEMYEYAKKHALVKEE